MCINEKVMELRDIKKLMFDRIKMANIILKNEILFDHEFDEFGYTCVKVMNILCNGKIGYSFIDSVENGFMNFNDKMLKTLLENPLIGSQFIKRVRDGNIE